MRKLLTLLLASCSIQALAGTNGSVDLLPVGNPLISFVEAQITSITSPRPNGFSYAMPSGDSTGLYVVFQDRSSGYTPDFPTLVTYGGVPMELSSNSSVIVNTSPKKFMNVVVFFLNDSMLATRVNNVFAVTYFKAIPDLNSSYSFTIFSADEVKQSIPWQFCAAQQTGGNFYTNDSISCGASAQLPAGSMMLNIGACENVNAGPLSSNFSDTIVNRQSNSMWQTIFYHPTSTTATSTPYIITNGTNAGQFIFLSTILENIATPGGTSLGAKLNLFTAARHNDRIAINWEAFSESDLRHYEVQYSSDGQNYTTVGVASPNTTGNTLVPQSYSFFDQPRAGKAYYRLRIVETRSGPSFYSCTVSVDKAGGHGVDVLIYPNPSNGTFAIRAEDVSNSNIKITNAYGQSIGYTIVGSAGSEITMQLKTAVPGIYYITFSSNGSAVTIKMFVH